MTIGLAAAFAVGFALLVLPAITAERWLGSFGFGAVEVGHLASLTVRVPPFAGTSTPDAHVRGGGVVIARGEIATPGQRDDARAVAAAQPRGPMPYIAFVALLLAFGAIFSHHMERSTRGRLLRVQLISLVGVALFAALVKSVLLGSALSVLIMPVAVFALVPTLALDRTVGIATGVLAALVVALLGPFDVSIAILMLVQAATAGLVVAERPKHLLRATVIAGAVTTVFTAATYLLLSYLTTGVMPSLADPLHSPLLAAAIGPALATAIAVPLIPLYQLMVGEITHGKLVALEDLSNPLLRQIAERAPGTWQHSLMMANMAEIAANAIGANGRLVRVGAYYHDLGKSLSPKYFIENLDAGETSPHDRLPPEVSCDAIFAHVTEGIVTARKAGLHERIVDFMHMHHGNGVLEYFWGKTREQGNPRGFTIEQFRYPGHPPQSRETAILAICDAVEAASRTLKKPDAASIGSLVQRIVYGKLHLGQLDESGLSMSDLRQVSDSLRETIRHANHGRIEYPWQKAEQDASASAIRTTGTAPRLDSLDRRPAAGESKPAMPAMPASSSLPVMLPMPDQPSTDPLAETALRRRPTRAEAAIEIQDARAPETEDVIQLVNKTSFDDTKTPTGDFAIVETARHDEPSDRARSTRIGHSPTPEVRVRRGSGEARGDRRSDASASIPSGEVQREAKRDVPTASEDIRRAVARTRDPEMAAPPRSAGASPRASLRRSRPRTRPRAVRSRRAKARTIHGPASPRRVSARRPCRPPCCRPMVRHRVRSAPSRAPQDPRSRSTSSTGSPIRPRPAAPAPQLRRDCPA
ncbi:MAG: HDIG domain-containing metalloprotein [Kofleriaceae bacterium]